jgi:SAM-dependent methyltransferase
VILTKYSFDQIFQDPEAAERVFQELASSSPDLALERLYWHPEQIGRLRGWAFLGVESPTRKRAKQFALKMNDKSHTHQKLNYHRDRAVIMDAIDFAKKIIRPIIVDLDADRLWDTNNGLSQYGSDPFHYLVEVESKRYLHAAALLAKYKQQTAKVFDLGTFIPILPIALSRLGYDVTICEKFSLYSEALRDVVHSSIANTQITVLDIDMLSDSLGFLRDADAVLLMAVVEHFNGSPKKLLDRMFSVMPHGSILIFEVPNIADLAKRVRLLIGRSPLPPYSLYFNSAYPFTGHNREMTTDEVIYALKQTGFVLETIYTTDYSPPCSKKDHLIRLAKRLLPIACCNETIFAVARKP